MKLGRGTCLPGDGAHDRRAGTGHHQKRRLMDQATSLRPRCRSVPLLDAAAVDAVRQWKYAPARLNGEPIPVLITVTVNFVLGAR